MTGLLNAQPIPDAHHPWPLRAADGTPQPFHQRGEWPAKWIYLPAARARTPVVCLYRCLFSTTAGGTVRLHASADERYDLFLDGQRIGRGPERGDGRHWYYDTYDLPLEAGEHVLVARVWSLGLGRAPWSQVTLRHGFLAAPQEMAWVGRLGTGTAPWQAKIMEGYAFRSAGKAAWASVEVIDASAMDWTFASGSGEGWQAVEADRPARSARESSFVHTFEHALYPARLPALLSVARRGGTIRHVDAHAFAESPAAYDAGHCLREEVRGWQALLEGEPLLVPAHTRRRVLIDLDDYMNAYPLVRLAGGAGGEVGLAWAEALQQTPTGHDQKGHRDEIDGRYFNSAADTLRLNGGECAYQPLWWRCGRYVQCEVRTASEPLAIQGIEWEETRYPYNEDGAFECDDSRINQLMRLCVRSAQCCAHESFMDCPYYEQQMWVGDMRVQMLLSHVLSGDPRLPRRCIEYIGETRDAEGMVYGRYPAPQRLWIPSFALWWVAMLHDYGQWRGDGAFVRRMMPAARGTIEAIMARRNADGLVETPAGWNYTDWSGGAGWRDGEPPHSLEQPSAILNWHLVLTLAYMEELERWLGEPELATRWERLAAQLASASTSAFWRPERGLLADDPQGRTFSEHAQALAVLTGRLPAGMVSRLRDTLTSDASLARTSYFYDCYLLDALRELGRMDAFFQRLGPYLGFADQGFRTTPEKIEPTRSDCHAWSAHPRCHAIRSVLGLRPTAWGLEEIECRPDLGPLRRLRAVVPHPRGVMSFRVERTGSALLAEVNLPAGVPGVFHHAGQTHKLHPGRQTLTVG